MIPKPEWSAVNDAASNGIFGVLESKPNDSLFASATKPPASLPGGGLFGGNHAAPRPQSVSSFSPTKPFRDTTGTSDAMFPSCLLGRNPSGKASVPTPSSPSQPNHRSQPQTGFANLAQPSNTLLRPGGLFGNPNTTVSAPSFGAFSQLSGSSHPSSGNSLFGNLSSPNHSDASFDQPVKAAAVLPGTTWSGSGFGAPVFSKLNALQDYQRQLNVLEERQAEVELAEVVAKRNPQHDAAHNAVLDSEIPALLNEVLSASLSDDGPERTELADPVMASHATNHTTPLTSKPTSVKEKGAEENEEAEKEGCSKDLACNNEPVRAGTANLFEDKNTAPPPSPPA
ncbi:uncharacterized protein M421DRAFT_274258 [Didymella exigua CBS 183.55]|uniref:Uncharacterized protein n=1 Tax=Didymella exigua CBS 183.55 TaxID=1150837 RepID=A0A6A5RGD4_9PLEO|nr:uncharacterized protein M421DRAFT_274258 [Didymella exigua CBS 183.55]KAF1924687.1 hypothetical protein M421DRAFT_274258 [Didymella exigua CBS 183.55]